MVWGLVPEVMCMVAYLLGRRKAVRLQLKLSLRNSSRPVHLSSSWLFSRVLWARFISALPTHRRAVPAHLNSSDRPQVLAGGDGKDPYLARLGQGGGRNEPDFFTQDKGASSVGRREQ